MFVAVQLILLELMVWLASVAGGCVPWHTTVNETVHHALVSGGVPAVLEPVGVCRDDGKRLMACP